MLVAQSCPTLCDPMDCSLTGFSVHGILKARIEEWVAILGIPQPGIEPVLPAVEALSPNYGTTREVLLLLDQNH